MGKKPNKKKKKNDETPAPMPLQSPPTSTDTIEAPTTLSSATSSNDSNAYDLLHKIRWGSFDVIAKTDFLSTLHNFTPEGKLSSAICSGDDEGSVKIPRGPVDVANVEKGVVELQFEIDEPNEELTHGAIEGSMVSFMQYPNINEANLSMNVLQMAGVEEIVSPIMVLKSNSIWLAIERADCTLHEYMKQFQRKWSNGKLDDSTKMLVRDIIGGVAELERQGLVAKLNTKDIMIVNGHAKLMKLSIPSGCQLMMQRQNLQSLLEELLGPIQNSKELKDFYSRVKRFPTCRLGHLRNHPLLLTPKERFFLPVIAIILLNFGRTASTWKTSYNQQFESHEVDIGKKVQGDKEYWRIFTHTDMCRYQSTPANQVIFSRNTKSHLNDEKQCKVLEQVEEELNTFFPNMLPDLSSFLMDQGIDIYHKENEKYGEDVLSRLHSILKRSKLNNGNWDTRCFCEICRLILSLMEICSYMIPEASQSQGLSSVLTNFREKIQRLESHFLKNQFRFRNLRLMSQDPAVVNSKTLFSFFQSYITFTGDFIEQYARSPEADVSKLLGSIFEKLEIPQEFCYLLKYVPSSYQLKELLANPKDVKCGSSIAGFLFQLE